MAQSIKIVEVAPRDGLQNETSVVPTDLKLRLIANLSAAGLLEIEASSFVSPKWVPQLADAEEIAKALEPGRYDFLVPNRRGLETALDCGVSRIALFTAASNTFCLRNINMSQADSLSLFENLASDFKRLLPGGYVRGYLSTCFECPYEGRISPDQVAPMVDRLIQIGCEEVSLGDTVGRATPSEVSSLLRELSHVPREKLALHLHDTHGTAIANVAQGLNQGIAAFDSSAGGLGGCPYAPGAGGNLATEDLVYFLHREGLQTGVDLGLLARSTLELLAFLGRSPSAKSQVAELSRSNADSCAK